MDFIVIDIISVRKNKNIVYLKEDLKERGLISTGFHLPYNPKLVDRAKKLRKNMTIAEKKLWKNYLKTSTYRFLRQRPIDHYIVDFYCANLKLVIEIDGNIHDKASQKEYDEQRTLFLKVYDLNVIRFRNEEVMNEFENVCERIGGFLNFDESYPPKSPLLRGT